MKSLLDQFKDHIAAKSREALLKLRLELLTTSTGGAREMTETEREVAMVYAKAIDEEILQRERRQNDVNEPNRDTRSWPAARA